MARTMKVVCFAYIFCLLCQQVPANSQDVQVDAPEGIQVGTKLTSVETSADGPASSPRIFVDYHDLGTKNNITINSHTSSNHLEVFCYTGEQKKLQTFFKTVEAQLFIANPSYRYYESCNASEVRLLYSDSSWFSFSPWRPSTFRFDLYNESCIGIETAESYRMVLRVRFFDLWRVLAVCCGALLFTTAPSLARNLLFHYMSASALGVVGSFIIVLLLVARYIPKRSGAVSLMVGGSGLFLYLLQLLHSNFVYLINEYYNVFLGYVSCAALLSFAAVYRCGGIADPRSLQLLQWLLQGCGLTAVYCSSQHREATLALVLLLLVHHNAPPFFGNTVRTVWRRRFPPKVNLLTEEEFIQQGTEETAVALDQLRTYCRSPDCNAWKTLSRLQTPQRKRKRQLVTTPRTNRFAEFVEGSSHLQDEEILQYEHAHYSRLSPLAPPSLDLTDDEDNVTDDEAHITDDKED